MNKVILSGRLTKDPEYRHIANSDKGVAKFTLAVDRKGEGADFISCTTFGKVADWMQKYTKKGTKLNVCGRIETGSYEKNGVKVYTTDIIVEEYPEFCETKKQEFQPAQGELPFR